MLGPGLNEPGPIIKTLEQYDIKNKDNRPRCLKKTMPLA